MYTHQCEVNMYTHQCEVNMYTHQCEINIYTHQCEVHTYTHQCDLIDQLLGLHKSDDLVLQYDPPTEGAVARL